MILVTRITAGWRLESEPREPVAPRQLRALRPWSGSSHGFSSSRAPAQEEDKTIILADLAVTLAPAGQRVVVLDCDPCRPREHQFFGLSNRPVVIHERRGAVRRVLARMTP
jgi:hypothetical protein